MTVVIAGASGFIGTRLRASFGAAGETVRTVGRSGDATWGDTAAIARLVDGADLVVNLAGKSVDCRYGPVNRAEILRSRIATTTELGEAIRRADAPPELWINSSTATIYRHADDRPQTEADGELGEGFSVGVARAWEEAFFGADVPGVRRAALRTAITLGDGSALVPLLLLARVGLGGAQLDGPWPATRARLAAGTSHRFGTPHGRQRVSWVHVDDVVGVVGFLRERRDLDGVLNVSSPHPVDSATLMRTLRRVLGVPIGIPLPRIALELGAFVLRTETELVLKSRWVLPERLQAAGYRFAQPELEPALRAIVAERARPAGTQPTRR
ncbi:epimerase [Pseudolysinimonas sp.]|uniref:epimerase n=1 Tax=Pseudolysinimonas sp. TaxID=2680009 RepID=UPI003F80FFD9